jgi:monothiol glutaredoxin
MSDINIRINDLISSNKVVLFMKGDADFPQCGFSALATQILSLCNVEFVTVNILEDEELRQAMKAYSSWPTFPQLYIKGELIGGSDIMREMYESGKLQQLLA